MTLDEFKSLLLFIDNEELAKLILLVGCQKHLSRLIDRKYFMES